MSRYDADLAQRLDDCAIGAGMLAAVMVEAASRLRQLSDLPAHLLPPPPILPMTIAHVTPAQMGGDTLELRDGLGDGFHDVGTLPAKNARLRKPAGGDLEADVRPRRIFEDPRLQPGYRAPKK